MYYVIGMAFRGQSADDGHWQQLLESLVAQKIAFRGNVTTSLMLFSQFSIAELLYQSHMQFEL